MKMDYKQPPFGWWNF